MTIQHRHIEIDGLRLHVAEAGEGTPIIFLHGWPEFWATWEPVMQRLRDQFRLVDVLPEAFENVSIDIAEDCGHFVHYENPDRAAKEIAAFFHREDEA